MGNHFTRGTPNSSVCVPQASPIALAIALLFPLGASAAEYLVSSDAELRAALNSASTDGDPSATIRLASSFTITSTTAFPSPSKPIIFDTQGYVLSRDPGATGFTAPGGSSRTYNGTYVGTTGTSTNNGLSHANGTAINNGTVTGGSDTDSGSTSIGGAGMVLGGSATLTNNGAILGGSAIAGAAGAGVSVNAGSNVVNSAGGTITGGDGNGGTAGSGVAFGNTASPAFLLNHGTIRGGDDTSGGTGGGYAARFATGTYSVENTGLMEGGSGAAAVYTQPTSNTTLSIINSGTIRSGDGATNAIQFGATANSRATLELQAGSRIIGNVVASAAGTNDAFVLGGSANDVFDVSAIGDSAQYRYFDSFTKTGSSTWALTGTGTNATAWTIDAGTLQLGNGGASGSLASDVVVNSGATLAFNRSDSYTFSQLISGAGGVAQNGTGTTVLDTAQTYTGPTTVNVGTLSIEGSITSAVTVNTAGTLSGSGTVFGNVTNTGTVAPGASMLTIAGDYIGNGGTVRVNTALGGDGASTGQLVVTGDTSGSGQIQVLNVGGTGALTAEGIKVIDVQGLSNASFTLAGDYTFQGQQAVVAGAYGYRLYQNGVSTPADGDWYLRSTLMDTTSGSGSTASATPLLAPTVPLYEAYSGVLQRFNEIGTLQQRVGNRSWSPTASVHTAPDGRQAIGHGAWARMEGSNTDIDPDTSTTRASYDVRTWKFEGGVDTPVMANQAGTLVVGPTFHYGTANSNVSSVFGRGTIDATGYGLGAAATWYGRNGAYVDARITATWYDTDIRSSTLGTTLVNNNRGRGMAGSVEAGHRLALSGSWSLTPQIQLAWSQVRFNAFTDQYGAHVSRNNGDSLVTRLGVSLDHETQWTAANGKARRSHVYGIANLYHDAQRGTSAQVADVHVTSKEQALWAGLGMGASLNWDQDRYTLYGELLARTSVQDFGDSHAISAKLGFRMNW
ncbi:autotransporter outer membrane beta-barrel domain-containing protein [Comamonas terrigena]|uniref:autotransporter family protein n=1 Tax=Comamonas terrigena TaxID=32013 RepID=UPI0024491E4F|nr:autotransporter outer membrane beta-barrel domain-containing protein [Comamonas terrigena]MDH1293218.1 autotransporter outer membrane beta-barrel domain-containing protein [Comamonas terrigena]